MVVKILLTMVLLCAVLVNSNSDCGKNRNITPDYVRVKRAKYYSSPPQRFYRRPPFSYPNKSVYSYTPPPSYMDDEEGPPSYRPAKVNRRPNSEGLGEEDINNIIKYLSKQDIDKIIEFAGEQHDKFKGAQYEKNNGEHYNTKKESKIYKPTQELDQNFSLKGPSYINNDVKVYDNNLNKQYVNDAEPKIINNPFISNIGYFAPLDTEESMQSSQVSFLNADINKETNKIPEYNNGNLFTDSKTMQEEHLPRPLNLRDETDFDASFTNNIQRVVKPDTNSYKIENFGDLPLMDYNSKLHTVSSYHVPHYTVTTTKKISSPSYSSPPSSSSSPSSAASSKSPEYEAAPPVSAAKEQSDAHLKAIKIWTHRSKGTAYYLHSDGTLSLEIPTRRKPYGHP